MSNPITNPYFTGINRECGCVIGIVIYWSGDGIGNINVNPDSMIDKHCYLHLKHKPRPPITPEERIDLLHNYDLRTENIRRMQAECMRIVY